MAESDPKPLYRWIAAGEEWSQPWGGSAAQWAGAIYPRISKWLPAQHIVEIACGYGRWTEFLRQHCEELTAVDASAECIAACRERFAEDTRLVFEQNEGRSLFGVRDRSVNFVFTFDSLVHIDASTLAGYIREIARVLADDGAAFVHHSNLGAYPMSAHSTWPKAVRKFLENLAILTRTNQRSPDMSAARFRELCAQHGLSCIRQELVNWRSRGMIDCLSTIVRRDSRYDGNTEVVRNRGFMREAERVRERAGE